MDTTVAPPVHFLNISYFFRALYDLFAGAHAPSTGGLLSFASALWFLYSVIAYLVTLVCIGLIVYYSTRLYQVTREIDANYGLIQKDESHAKVEHSRWTYIRQLIESPQESDWRQAIIESDIMLDEMLSKNGFQGESVGEKLKTANPAHFATLNDAWTAHRVRNDIAHQGSTFQLSDQIAYRTIGHYENVFREFGEI